MEADSFFTFSFFISVALIPADHADSVCLLGQLRCDYHGNDGGTDTVSEINVVGDCRGKGERGQRSRVSSVRRQVKEDLSDNGLAGMQPCVQPELMDTAERCYRQRGSQCQPRLERVK